MKKLNRDFPASDIYLPRTGNARICRAPSRLPGRNNTKSGMSFDERHTASKYPKEDRTDQYRLLP